MEGRRKKSWRNEQRTAEYDSKFWNNKLSDDCISKKFGSELPIPAKDDELIINLRTKIPHPRMRRRGRLKGYTYKSMEGWRKTKFPTLCSKSPVQSIYFCFAFTFLTKSRWFTVQCWKQNQNNNKNPLNSACRCWLSQRDSDKQIRNCGNVHRYAKKSH